MPRNIFGLEDEGGLSNPLTEDLLANGFNALDFNEVHLNELHDNSGTGKIVVHEDFNMTNNHITNLADPVAGKDAVTLGFAESNYASQASVPDQAPYDVYAAFSDELSPLSAGLQPVVVPASRDFTLTHVRCFLTTASGIAYFTINDFRKNGVSFGVAAPGCEFVNPTDTMSVLSSTVIPISVNQGDRFEIVLNPTGTATGLKVVFMGYVSI
jgi:hypothetical protein